MIFLKAKIFHRIVWTVCKSSLLVVWTLSFWKLQDIFLYPPPLESRVKVGPDGCVAFCNLEIYGKEFVLVETICKSLSCSYRPWISSGFESQMSAHVTAFKPTFCRFVEPFLQPCFAPLWIQPKGAMGKVPKTHVWIGPWSARKWYETKWIHWVRIQAPFLLEWLKNSESQTSNTNQSSSQNML